MDEAMVYGLFFAAVLYNYVMKLRLERQGTRVERSTPREGIIFGLTAYMLYQAIQLPGIPPAVMTLETVLGASSLVAGTVFFMRARKAQRSES